MSRPTAPSRSRDERLRAIVLGEGDFVARCLRNLGVWGGEVDDCVQKVFLVVARRIDEVEPGKERAFLYGCARNTAAHFRRSLARRREVSDEGLAEQAHHQPGPDELTEDARMRRLLDEVLDTLDDDARAVFVLHTFEDLTMAEIAQMVEAPPGTVASRLRRAREHFKREVKRHTQELKRESA